MPVFPIGNTARSMGIHIAYHCDRGTGSSCTVIIAPVTALQYMTSKISANLRSSSSRSTPLAFPLPSAPRHFTYHLTSFLDDVRGANAAKQLSSRSKNFIDYISRVLGQDTSGEFSPSQHSRVKLNIKQKGEVVSISLRNQCTAANQFQ